MNQSRDDQSRAGFTLVELLMVILIISMLISLLLPAVNAARVRALEASIHGQIEQLAIGRNQVHRAVWSRDPPFASVPCQNLAPRNRLDRILVHSQR